MTGLPASSRRQWDWPFGWAPHQILAWEGLRKSGFHDDARRICYRWVSLLVSYYSTYGCVPEKIDVVNDDTQRDKGDDIEYGTQCNNPGEYFGWTCASLAVAHGKGYITAADAMLINTPIVDSIERQLNMLSSIDKQGCKSGSESLTWSTISSSRFHESSTSTDELFP